MMQPSAEGVIIDLSRVVPALKDYNMFAMPLNCWELHEKQMKAMGAAERIAKLRRSKKQLRECLRGMKNTQCPTMRAVLNVTFKRFMVTTAVITYTILRIHDPKAWPLRKYVTPKGVQSIMHWLSTHKRRWTAVNAEKGNVHLYTDEPRFYNIAQCACHPGVFDKHLRPNLSLRKK